MTNAPKNKSTTNESKQTNQKISEQNKIYDRKITTNKPKQTNQKRKKIRQNPRQINAKKQKTKKSATRNPDPRQGNRTWRAPGVPRSPLGDCN